MKLDGETKAPACGRRVGARLRDLSPENPEAGET